MFCVKITHANITHSALITHEKDPREKHVPIRPGIFENLEIKAKPLLVGPKFTYLTWIATSDQVISQTL